MHRYEKGIPDRETAQSYLERIIHKARETPRTHYHLAITVPPVEKIIGHISLTSQNLEIQENVNILEFIHKKYLRILKTYRYG